MIVAAWGRHARKADSEPIAGMLSRYHTVWCLGVNKHGGQPAHPLMLNSQTERVIFNPKLFVPEAA